jgi:predicted dehydrogenase
MSSHDIELISWFLDVPVLSVTARETRGVLDALGVRVHDGVDAVIAFAGGATLNLHSSWIHPESYPTIVVDRMTIVGDAGVIEFYSRGRQVECYTRTGGTTMTFTGPQTATEVNGRLEGAFRSSLLAFLTSIVSGQEAPTSAARTLHVVETQEAILRAANSAQTPTINVSTR